MKTRVLKVVMIAVALSTMGACASVDSLRAAKPAAPETISARPSEGSGDAIGLAVYGHTADNALMAAAAGHLTPGESASNTAFAADR